MPDQHLLAKLTTALARAEGPATVTELLARCDADASRSQVQLALDALITLGRIERRVETDPQYQKPFFAYQLKSREAKP
jgi:predicted transcriptional regulator